MATNTEAPIEMSAITIPSQQPASAETAGGPSNAPEARISIAPEIAPEYSEPLISELRLIADIQLSPIGPDYYGLIRPDRLEDKIPNHVFVARITELNRELEVEQSIQRNRIYAWSIYFVMLLATVAWMIVYAVGLMSFSKNWVFVLITLILLLVIQPSRPKYVAQVRKAVAIWSKADAAQGINLVYSVKPDRTFNANLFMSCPILFYERLTEHGDGSQGVTHDLPEYAPKLEE
ncbi:hypothetical protein HDU98_006865 [Podochytrium sp. JEL0797]|nr:hypothetical protein HDU98_006865 [Podochytrium sp. JEL0797]